MVLRTQDRALRPGTAGVSAVALLARLADVPTGVAAFVTGALGTAAAAAVVLTTYAPLVVGGGLLAAAIPLLLVAVGVRSLPAVPVRAVLFMGGGLLTLLWVLAAAGSATIVLTAVALAPGADAPQATAELLGAASGLVSALATYLVVKPGSEADGLVADWIKGRFESAYQDDARVTPGSSLELAVFSNGWRGLNGWGRSAREERAALIAAELAHA